MRETTQKGKRNGDQDIKDKQMKIKESPREKVQSPDHR